MANIRTLHVDDDPQFVEAVASFFATEHDSITFVTETSATDGLARLAEDDIDCVVSDYEMPGMDGLEFLEAVREEHPDVPFILFTGKGSEEIASRAISAGVTEYLQKQRGTEVYEMLAHRISNAVERARAKTTAQYNHRRFQNLAAAFPDIAFYIDEHGQYLDVLTGAGSPLLYDDADQLVGEVTEDVIPDETAARFMDTIERAIETGSVQTIEYQLDVQAGTRWFEGRVSPIETTLTTDRAVIWVARDITDRKQREQSFKQYRTLVESVGDPMYVLDKQGRIKFANTAMCEELRIDSEEIVGRDCSEFMVEGDFERGTALLTELLEDPNGTSGRYDITVVRTNGESFPAECHIAPLLDDESFVGSVGAIRDITDRIEHERTLERQNERLDEFVSVVSHDLANPLNVAQLRLDLVEADDENIDAAKQALDRMETLTEDLLQLAREGKVIAETKAVPLAETVESCWETVETTDAELEAPVESLIEADESRFKQLVENLVRNSVEHGGDDVTVTVGLLEDGFYVEDDGQGIPEDARTKLFESGYSSTEDGTGYGLHIVKQIADAHDWTITVTSGPGGGARFEFTDVEFV